MIRKFLIFTLAVFALDLLAAVKPLFYFDGKHTAQTIFKNGAKISGGVMKLDGKKQFAEFKNSGNFHFTKTGMTLVGEVKLLDEHFTGTRPGRDMILAKGNEFVFSREGGRFYFNFHNGKRWCAAFWAGTIPAPGKWVQFAATVQPYRDIAQGADEFRIKFYINGELDGSGKVSHVMPKLVKSNIQIGCGFGGGPWYLHGEYGFAAVYDRVLSDDEIAKLAANSQRVDLRRNDLAHPSPALAAGLSRLTAAARTPQAKWIAGALKRAAMNGFNQKKLAKILPSPQLLGSKAELAELLKKWNPAPFKVLLTPDMAVMTAVGSCGTGFPLYGIYDLKKQKEILGDKSINWQVSGVSKPARKRIFNSLHTRYNSKFSASGSALNISWQLSPQITATATMTVAGASVTTDFAVANNDRNFLLQEVIFPETTFAKQNAPDALVLPAMSGILVKNPTVEQFSNGQEGWYPSGRINMQFGAYYGKSGGVYFALHDPVAKSKYYSVKGKFGNITAYWSHPVGYRHGSKGANSFKMSGYSVISLLHGDWFDAGQLYKKFLAKESSWWIKELPRKDTPEWFRDNSLWLLGVKCSYEHSARKLKDTALQLRKYFEMPFALHWYGWEDPAKGLWPNFYPKAHTMIFLKELKSAGIYVKPYIDTRLWAVAEKQYNALGLKFAVKNSDGSVNREVYSAKSIYAVMCPAVDGWVKWIVNLSDRIGSYGFDAIYHDQVATARPFLCYDASHKHQMGGSGVWLEDGYLPMFRKIRALKNKYPHMAHDTEEAAEPYLQAMDGFMVWRWTDPDQIPLFTSIYSGRAQFTGRLFNHQVAGDHESFFAKAAEQLVMAEQIGWFDIPDMNHPEKRLFIKRLIHLRRALLNYFNAGEMRHPLKFEPAVKTQTTRWGTVGKFNPVTTPVVRHSIWQGKNDLQMLILLNSTSTAQTVHPQLDCRGKFALIGSTGKITSGQGKLPAVTVAPRQAAVIVIGKNCQPEAERIAKIMKQISGFTGNYK